MTDFRTVGVEPLGSIRMGGGGLLGGLNNIKKQINYLRGD